MAQKSDGLENRQRATHCAIIHANREGAPHGQIITPPAETSTEKPAPGPSEKEKKEKNDKPQKRVSVKNHKCYYLSRNMHPGPVNRPKIFRQICAQDTSKYGTSKPIDRGIGGVRGA